MLLLDTHFVISLVEDNGARYGGAWRTIHDPETPVHVSVASLWEIAIKVRLGKLPSKVPLPSLPEALGKLGVVIIEINSDHVLAELDPDPPTRDPFDRLLLAQCQVEGMKLVTIDRKLSAHPLAWQPA